MHSRRLFVAAAFAICLSACSGQAHISPLPVTSQANVSTDWPWWRGPLNSGVALNSTVRADNVGSMALAWRADLGSKGFGTPAVAGNVVVASATNAVSAFDATTGTKLWSFSSPEKYLLFSGPAIVSRREVIVSTAWGGAATYALDLQTGNLLWEQNWGTNFGSYGGALPVNDNEVAIVLSNQTEPPCSHGEVVTLSASTGVVIWRHLTAADGDGAGIWSAPNLGHDGSILVTTGNSCGTPMPGDEPDSVLSLNAQTGVENWRFFAVDSQNDPTDSDLDFGSTPVDAAGLVVAASKSGRVYGIGRSSGAQVWEERVAAASCCPDQGGSISSPAFDGQRLYVGGGTLANDGAGYLQALDTAGNVKWDFASAQTVVSPPAVANDVVLVGSADELVALNAQTGVQLWSFPTRGRVWAGAAISGNSVFTESNDDGLYAFRVSQ